MRRFERTASRPPDRHTVAALRVVARALGQDCAYVDGGRFVFPLADGWSLAVSPDSAGRFRLDACLGRSSRGTLWSRATDHRRLAALAVDLRHEVGALNRRG